MFCERIRSSTLEPLHHQWRAVSVYLVTRSHFYPEADILVEILLVPARRRGLLVPCLFRGVRELFHSGPPVL